jgi:hypothetical protein
VTSDDLVATRDGPAPSNGSKRTTANTRIAATAATQHPDHRLLQQVIGVHPDRTHDSSETTKRAIQLSEQPSILIQR